MSSTLKDWDAAQGVECPQCHRETLRLVALNDGKKGCMKCKEGFRKLVDKLMNLKDNPNLSAKSRKKIRGLDILQ